MQIKSYFTGSAYRFNLIIYLIGLSLIVPIIFVLNITQFKLNAIVLTIGIPFISIFLFDFNSFKYLFIVSLFTNFFLFGLYFCVFMALSLIISFILINGKINFEIFDTPLTRPIIFYYITIIPSLINSSNIILSFYLQLNLLAIIILFLIFGFTLTKYEQIKKILMVFFLLVAIDSMVIIYLGLTKGGREFGFSGVVFVDYSVMVIISLLVISIFKRGKSLFPYLGLAVLVFAGLIFTQTRNTFISLALASLTIVIYLIFNRKGLNISAKRIISTFSVIIILVLLVVVLLSLFSPSTFERFDELKQESAVTVRSESDLYKNSLMTRLLIWDTAINAFKHHPIIGIGVYSFPFESAQYYTISKELFKDYVKGLSPHITYLAVLTETGILGFIGFIIFLISSIRLGIKSLNLASTEQQKFYSLLILSLNIYIFYSMFLSDAWLWGQCGMLWGMILGMSIANYKIIKNSKVDADIGK